MRHYVVVHHGVSSGPDDVAALARVLEGLPGVLTLLPGMNSADGTWAPRGMRWLAHNPSNDGVEQCGMRLAEYIVARCEPPAMLSLVGHSFGGLVVREAARVLRVWAERAWEAGADKLREAAFFRNIRPHILATFATPHLGAFHPAAPFSSLVIGATGEDISLSTPALWRLADSPASRRALACFSKVVFYGCVTQDPCVPYYSAVASLAPPPSPPVLEGLDVAHQGVVGEEAEELGLGDWRRGWEVVWGGSSALAQVLRTLAPFGGVRITRVPVYFPAGDGHQLLVGKGAVGGPHSPDSPLSHFRNLFVEGRVQAGVPEGVPEPSALYGEVALTSEDTLTVEEVSHAPSEECQQRGGSSVVSASLPLLQRMCSVQPLPYCCTLLVSGGMGAREEAEVLAAAAAVNAGTVTPVSPFIAQVMGFADDPVPEAKQGGGRGIAPTEWPPFVFQPQWPRVTEP
eukprot:Hpha_TRINITY_DN33643_c0_g1::TRINITY_DN33643_c0_g1_i1::g.43243::m.43243